MENENAHNNDGTASNDSGQQRKLRAIEPFRWQKGQSGNPGGRPKRKPISDAYTALLDAIDPKTGLTGAQLVAQAMFLQAFKGNVQAVKEITDRVEGALRQSVDVVFGSMTDEELEEWIAEHLADAGGPAAGGEAPGDEPGGNSATAPAGESPAG